MKRRTLFVALASASALSLSAYGNDQSSKQSSQNEETQQQQSASAGQSQQNPQLVKQAQEKLAAAGKDVGTPDGKMGPKTQAALKDFQQEKGLQASGQLDDQTLGALEINEGSSATGGTSSSDQGGSSAGGDSGNAGSSDNSSSSSGQSGK